MKTINRKSEPYFRAQKRVKDIIGFYTHLIVTVFVIPFIIYLNLDLVPQFEWYWIFIGAWIVGLLIHGINVFGIYRFTFKYDWEQRKMQEFMGTEDYQAHKEQDHGEELRFVEAKKKIEEIKGFYWHLAVTVLTIPMIIWVNYEFVPEFTFFRYAVGGMVLALIFHWLGVFGLEKIGLGKEWQERKIKQLLQEEKFKQYN